MINQKPAILIDMDGVIVDFVHGALRAHAGNISLARHLDYWINSGRWPKREWFIPKVLGITEEYFWEIIDQIPYFWEALEPYECATDLIIGCQQIVGKENVFLCSVPSRNPESASGKLKWLANWGIKIGFDSAALRRQYILTPKKHLLAHYNKILIDDSDTNCHSFVAHGGAACIYPRHWNSAGMAPDEETGVAQVLESVKIWHNGYINIMNSLNSDSEA